MRLKTLWFKGIPSVSGAAMAAKYHAVTIRAVADCCSAVRQFKDRVFLAAEAPLLPLRDCTLPDRCQCHYAKRNDRRDGHGDRRGFPGPNQYLMRKDQDKRSGKPDRRHDD